VDHPPFSIFLLRLVREAIGDSLPALRLIPSLAGAATVFVIGLTARRLGASLVGQATASLAAMVGSIYHVVLSYYSMNPLGLLIWALAFLILVEIERQQRPRLWLLLGVLAGLGLQNKHTFVLFLVALAVGLVLTRTRRHLRGRWLWIGLAVAGLLFLPNLIWQAGQGWPSIEFYRNATIYKNVSTPPLAAIAQQALFMNPLALPVWLGGLVFFLLTRRGRRYRHLSIVYLVLLLTMILGRQGRPDRIAGAYTILFAGGGVLLGEAFGRRGLRWAYPVLLVLSGVAVAPVGLPILPPETTARYVAALGVVPQIEKGEGKQASLPQWLTGRLSWEKLVDDVAAVAAGIEPDERTRAVIVAPSYSQAGALELLGRDRQLPPVYATQNSYFHWGPPPDSADVVIIVGPFSEEGARYYFEEVELARIHDCEWCMPWRDEIPIWLARKPRMRFSEAWPELRHYE
jgi:4-amino-4-deoxy-L-arabinose transferase-like glycosyltransferase